MGSATTPTHGMGPTAAVNGMGTNRKWRIRPWTQNPILRRRREREVLIPTVDTYRQHMERAQMLHKRLRLEHPLTDTWVSPHNSHRPHASSHTPVNGHHHFPRSRTFVSSRRVPTDFSTPHDQFVNDDHAENFGDALHQDSCEQVTQIPLLRTHPHRPMALSYPLIGRTDGVNPDHSTRKPIYADRRAWDFSRSKTEYVDKSPFSRDFDEATVTSGVGSSASSSGDEEFRGPESTPTGAHPESPKKRRKLDILQLCEHLKTHGLGEPVMSTSSHVPSTEKLPPGVKARRLPRDPSTREKIKGRARLDYELANLRAEAFCEQQHPRTFRTASANLRNRDMRLLEEEEREQVQKAMHENGENVVDEQDDDASSLVGSPLSREELFCRIEAWADDVDRALHRGHS